VLVHEAHEAARAVAAVLDLVAGVVEDPVAEVDAFAAAGLDEQDLVRATPRRRSPSLRNWAGVSSIGERVASSTTKSLPAPCILVNRSRMAKIMRGCTRRRNERSHPDDRWRPARLQQARLQ